MMRSADYLILFKSGLFSLLIFLSHSLMAQQPVITDVSPNPVCLGAQLTITYTGTPPVQLIRFDQGATKIKEYDDTNFTQNNNTLTFTIPLEDIDLLNANEVLIQDANQTSGGFPITICNSNITGTNPADKVCQGEMLEINATNLVRPLAVKLSKGTILSVIVPIPDAAIIEPTLPDTEWTVTLSSVPNPVQLRGTVEIEILSAYDSVSMMGTSGGAVRRTICAEIPIVDTLFIGIGSVDTILIPTELPNTPLASICRGDTLKFVGQWFRKDFVINFPAGREVAGIPVGTEQPRTVAGIIVPIDVPLGSGILQVTSLKNGTGESISDPIPLTFCAARPRPMSATCISGVLTITGQNLSTDTDISQIAFLDGTNSIVPASTGSATEITVDVPPGLAVVDTIKIKVFVLKDQPGESASEVFSIAITDLCEPAAPTISSINNTNIPTNSPPRVCVGQKEVIIKGTGFRDSTVVLIGGMPLDRSNLVISPTEIKILEIPPIANQDTLIITNGIFFGREKLVKTVIRIDPAMNLSFTPVNVSCNEDGATSSDGKIELILSGGIPNYAYQLSIQSSGDIEENASSTSDIFSIENLASNTYNLVIIDSDGCELRQDGITIGAPAPLSVNLVPSRSADQCLNNFVTLIANPTPETALNPPYSFEWEITAPNAQDLPDTTKSINASGGDTYQVTIKDALGCEVSDEFAVPQNGNSSVFITDFKTSYCSNEEVANITVSPPGGTFFIQSIDSIPFPVGPSGVVSINLRDSMLLGNNTLTYQGPITNEDPVCVNRITVPFNLYAPPTVIIDSIQAMIGSDVVALDSAYCQINERIRLNILSPSPTEIGTNDPPVFSGPGVVSDINTFIPELGTPGLDQAISLSYTDENGCSNMDRLRVDIYPLPKATFSITTDTVSTFEGIKVYCVGDILSLIDTSQANTDFPLAESITKKQWSFGDGAIGSGTMINHSYNVPGVYAITLLKENTFASSNFTGCEQSSSQTIIIGDRPKVNFSWKNICEGASTQFRDSSFMQSVLIPDTSLVDTLVSWTWQVGDSILQIPDTSRMPVFTFENKGQYKVKLIVKSHLGCTDSIEKLVNILPAIDVEERGYTETFDLNPIWVPESTNESIWQWGSSDELRIETPNRAWVVGSNNGQNIEPLYLVGQTGILNSPCFDISALKRPKVELLIHIDTDLRRDGVSLQYAQADSSWTTLGGFVSNGDSSGLYWYNRQGQFPRLGSNDYGLLGWSGSRDLWNNPATNSFWVRAVHRLDTLTSIEGDFVRFRLVFQSEGNRVDEAKAADGRRLQAFALDEFRIANREKTVLSEYFTNRALYAEVDAYQAKLVADNQSIDAQNRRDLVNLQYHLGFPDAGDPDYTAYRQGPSARSLYYGISAAGRTVIEGIHYNERTLNLIQNDLDLAMLKAASFEIEEVVKNGANIDIRIRAKDSLLQAQEIMLFAVAVDDTDDLNKVKNISPHAGGYPMIISPTSPWPAAEQRTISLPWSDCGESLVIFLQDYLTKEVYQAAFFPASEVCRTGQTIEDAPSSGLPSLSIYPNPSQSRFTLDFSWTLEEMVKWELIDAQGRRLDSGRLPIGQQRYEIGQESWSEGVYILQLFTPEIGLIRKKLILMRY